MISKNNKKLVAAKTAISLCFSPLRTFRQERCLRLSHRNSILMMYINGYIINSVVKRFKK